MKKKYLTIGTLFLLSLMLSGCMTTRKDGPPSYHVDASRIPDAIPKNEPLSKWGNKPTYFVYGKEYHVMQTRKHYVAVGVASWYGTRFHDHKTSSGERYDMLAMTAAHRSLPLPTYVQVLNLENHRKVIVKVNDRGPFKPNRIIDLSYVAAKKLGMTGRGTALVEIKTIIPHSNPSWLSIFIHKRTRLAKNIRSHPNSIHYKVTQARHDHSLDHGIRKKISSINRKKLKIKAVAVKNAPQISDISKHTATTATGHVSYAI